VLTYLSLPNRSDTSGRALEVVLLRMTTRGATREGIDQGVRVRLGRAVEVQNTIIMMKVAGMNRIDVIDPEAAVMSVTVGVIAQGVRAHETTTVDGAAPGMIMVDMRKGMKGGLIVIEVLLHHVVMKRTYIASRKGLGQKALDCRAAMLLRRHDMKTWVPIDSCWSKRGRKKRRNVVAFVKVFPTVVA